MTRMLMRRLEALERKLDPPVHQPVAILAWAHDSEDERDAKLVRWRAGEHVEGAPDIEDRNAKVLVVVFVKPGDVVV
jgi:hypothetical protein